MLPKVVETGAKNLKVLWEGNYFVHDQFIPKVTQSSWPFSWGIDENWLKNENANHFLIHLQ